VTKSCTQSPTFYWNGVVALECDIEWLGTEINPNYMPLFYRLLILVSESCDRREQDIQCTHNCECRIVPPFSGLLVPGHHVYKCIQNFLQCGLNIIFPNLFSNMCARRNIYIFSLASMKLSCTTTTSCNTLSSVVLEPSTFIIVRIHVFLYSVQHLYKWINTFVT